jgi:bacillithiol synthase
MGSTFFAAYIAGDTAAAALLPPRCTDPDDWDRAAARAATRAVAPALLAELRRQSTLLPPSSAREKNLDLLGAGSGASVVVTGQQVGLFLGPLYTLHKAATAVARARQVAQRTGRPCIPIFWLQTEDHDWAEIARAEILCQTGRRVFALPAESKDEARVSLAQRRLPPEVDTLVAELTAALAPLRHGREISALVARHYLAGRTPSAAFAGVLAELFAEEGLVLLDPRTEVISRMAAPVLRRALDQHAQISAALADRQGALTAARFEEQVRTRPEASLVFFHPRGPSGPRYRLVREETGWSTPEGTITHGALLQQLERDPLWFSTSALIRPLVQDTLLPTCAYLGGPAECTYFAQLPPVYAQLGVELPMIAPRARLRVVDEAAKALLDKLGLTAEETDLPREVLLKKLAPRPEGLASAEVLRERLLGGLSRELDALETLAPSLDPSLTEPIRKTRESCTGAISRLVERIDKAALGRDKVIAERLDRLLAMLRPDGEPQERVYAFPALAARTGARALIAALVEAAGPLSPEVRSVQP